MHERDRQQRAARRAPRRRCRARAARCRCGGAAPRPRAARSRGRACPRAVAAPCHAVDGRPSRDGRPRHRPRPGRRARRAARTPARAFYGALLGLEELPKPEALRGARRLLVPRGRAGAARRRRGAVRAGAQGAPGPRRLGPRPSLRGRLRAAGIDCEDDGGSRASTAFVTTRSATGSSAPPDGRTSSIRFAYGYAPACGVLRGGRAASFSQAAERLGVTQPAVSLQVRALEKRLGTQLLDRSGRRVEPTEAGLRLYRGAQRLLALEEQVVDEVADEATASSTARFEIGASTGPGGVVLSHLLCEFQTRTRSSTSCSGSSTRRRSSSASPTASSSSASSARRRATAASSSSRSSATR